MPTVAPADLARYARQMLLPDWGETAQRRVGSRTVFLAGAGGLGSPVAIYLAAAGVGRLIVADRDVVEVSNLNRQILHDADSPGSPKALSAARTLKRLNPDVAVVAHVADINDETVDRLSEGADVLVDCLDNFPTRYVLNRCALRRRIPLVHGAIWGLEGRLTFIEPGRTPCLRCTFPEAPPREVFPVLGATPGFVGCLQAVETLRYLAGQEPALRGVMVLFDAATMTCRRLRLRPDPGCPECGGRPAG